MVDFLETCAREAGAVLQRHFGRLGGVRIKESPASVVTEADLVAERCLLKRLRTRFPDDGVLAEESGWTPGRSEHTWVVDPLDGTSNFVAGLPWFGVMIARLRGAEPELAVLHLPALGLTYTAVAGEGARCNGRPVRVSAETALDRVLVSFAFDAAADPPAARRAGDLLAVLAPRVRNVRATNSLTDFCYTADGRLGGTVNLACKLWDLVAPALLIREAGGVVTGPDGAAPDFRPGVDARERTHALVAASPALHPRLLEALNTS